MNATELPADNRCIRVFVSSTFRDMMGERDELMTHAWPELRRFCRERQVELVEVDLRWGISEEQSTRKETLKLCLNEIRACRPFFVGLLGERYGWVPSDSAFTTDLLEDQPWLKGLHDKSVTELEILHGVLNNPEMAGRAFFYFRDPKYVEFVPADQKSDFAAENAESAEEQRRLKDIIRKTCVAKKIPLRENYSDPVKLSALVLKDLRAAIKAQFPIERIPDPLAREARNHEAFAETHRRTYIRRPGYFDRLNEHVHRYGPPLVVVGDSGCGKSALLANWVKEFTDSETREMLELGAIQDKPSKSGAASVIPHPSSFVLQHYVDGTSNSAEHWQLMTRIVAEIKRWTDDQEKLPQSHYDLLRDFPVWLARARIKAEREGVLCILVIDGLNQLEDLDRARLLGWLPSDPFAGPLRLVVSTLPGDTFDSLAQRGWNSLRVQPFSPDERRRMIAAYLQRFGKNLDVPRLERIAAAPAAANPLYLKILLDELRVIGTHDRLDESLTDCLAAPDIPALLKHVLFRCQLDYERDRPGLVGEALGLIWAARRGLTETELLRLLRPENLPQLPPAIWNPFRATLEDGLVNRNGILNFSNDFMRTAVAAAFVPDKERQDGLHTQLADYFEAEPVTARSCDELPWQLWLTQRHKRLRTCLLDIERFIEIHMRAPQELMRYWIELGEERAMGKPYRDSFDNWSALISDNSRRLAFGMNQLGNFLHTAALYSEAEPLMRRGLQTLEASLGEDHPDVATQRNNLAVLLQDTNQVSEAESLLRRALQANERVFGEHHAEVATTLNNLATLLHSGNRMAEAEPLLRRALEILVTSYGNEHPNVATEMSNLAVVLQSTDRLGEAESLYLKALKIHKSCLGTFHPYVARDLSNLAQLLQMCERFAEAEPLMRGALKIDILNYGEGHPDVAGDLNNLAQLLKATDRLSEAESLMRRTVEIFLGLSVARGRQHQHLQGLIGNYAALLQQMGRSPQEVLVQLNMLGQPFGIRFDH